MTNEISNSEDIIDSSDLIARLEALREARAGFVEQLESASGESPEAEADAKAELDEWDEEYGEELRTLAAFAEEFENYAPDYSYGEVAIRDSYFQEYAEQLAEDICAINKAAQWPNNCIDWEKAADQLKQDYTAIEFDGVTYWVR